MTKETRPSTKQSSGTPLELPKLTAVNYASTMAKMVEAMKEKGIDCHIERREGGGINVVVHGVDMNDDGDFVEVKDVE